MQENRDNDRNTPTGKEAGAESDLKMAQNSNPRANENVRDTPMEDNTHKKSDKEVGSEITDGEAG